jgi:PAP2 superfamily
MSRRVWLRGLALLYSCMSAFAVLATGNHYVLDVLAGLATLALATAIVTVLSRTGIGSSGAAAAQGLRIP